MVIIANRVFSLVLTNLQLELGENDLARCDPPSWLLAEPYEYSTEVHATDINPFE